MIYIELLLISIINLDIILLLLPPLSTEQLLNTHIIKFDQITHNILPQSSEDEYENNTHIVNVK